MISIRSNITDRLKSRWGQNLTGTMAIPVPMGGMHKSDCFNDLRVIREIKGDEATTNLLSFYKDDFLGYRNGMSFFVNNRFSNTLVGVGVIVATGENYERCGKIINAREGIITTDTGLVIASEDFYFASDESDAIILRKRV